MTNLVKQSFEHCQSPEEIWPDPKPIEASDPPKSYPLEALPETIQEAVKEVQTFIKAPLPLVATSALGALSLAIQAHIDVVRAEKLSGPVSLFQLTIAESGERKTTCDRLFMQPIRDYEQTLLKEAQTVLNEYHARLAAWDAKMAGLKSRITSLSKGTSDPDLGNLSDAEEEMRQLQEEKPKQPLLPRMLYVDITPEALAHNLAKYYPTAGIISAEGGIVMGSHGMNKDSTMRNLALYNQLWDGGHMAVDRKTGESCLITGGRLTISLQIQSETLRKFHEQNGTLARGSGFLARFLIAVPESTQGTRLYTEPPKSWPALEQYQDKLKTILEQPIPLTEDGQLAPFMTGFSSEAKNAWIECHDEIEKKLGKDGSLGEINDVASKAPDNIARLAALFHFFEHGSSTPICTDCLSKAALLVLWHLQETKRFFNEIALPPESIRIKKLDDWLIREAKKKQTHGFLQSHVLQYGPIRKADQLHEALARLVALDRIKITLIEKTSWICINPKLTALLPPC